MGSPWGAESPRGRAPVVSAIEGIPVQLGVEVSGVTEVGELSGARG